MRAAFAIVIVLSAVFFSPVLLEASIFGTGNILVLSQDPGSTPYRIREFQVDGTVVQTIIPPNPPVGSPNARDLVMCGVNQLCFYNGTSSPYLSIYDPISLTWTHRTYPGWSTIANVSYGGIARSDNYVFVTDMATAVDSVSGVIAFDIPTGTSTEFASNLSPIDLNLGLDGKLWVLTGQRIAYSFDPTTFAPLQSIPLDATIQDIRSIAVDAAGFFFAADWDGRVSKLSPNGSVLQTLLVSNDLTDIDIDSTGLMVVGTRSNGSWISDTALSQAFPLERNRWHNFVTIVPEPTSLYNLTLLGILSLKRRNRLGSPLPR